MARNREPLESESELESTVVQADSDASSRSRSKRIAPARSGAGKRSAGGRDDKDRKKKSEFIESLIIEEFEISKKMLDLEIARINLLLDSLRKKRLSAGKME